MCESLFWVRMGWSVIYAFGNFWSCILITHLCFNVMVKTFKIQSVYKPYKTASPDLVLHCLQMSNEMVTFWV